jgi:hypothetical protein
VSATFLRANDGGSGPPRLAIYQSQWGMGGLGTDGREWTAEEKLERIRDAGFEGVLVFDIDPTTPRWMELAPEYGLALGHGTFAATLDGIKRELDVANRVGATFLCAQSRDYFLVGDAATEFLRGAVQAGVDAGVACLVETHRACVTQDLIRTAEYLRAIPEMLLVVDFSHYVVAGQVPTVDDLSGPIPEGIEELLGLCLERAAGFHGRVSNGQQAQVDIGRDGDHPAVADFGRWWRQGMANWLGHAGPGDVLPFVPELGPPPYSITIRSADGATAGEISDRWEQALVLKRIAASLWDDVAQAVPA